MAQLIVLIGVLVTALLLGWWMARQRNERAVDAARKLIVFKVLMPREIDRGDDEHEPKDFQEIASVAEQLYSGFSSLYESNLNRLLFGQPTLSFEFVVKDGLISFYVTVPQEYQELTQRQLHSVYPYAEITPSTAFKIFEDDTTTAGMEIRTSKAFELPVKTYKTLESDPLNILTNAFSKLPEGTRAGYQILIRPTSGRWRDRTVSAAKRIAEGKQLQSSLINTFFQGVFNVLRPQSDTQKERQQEAAARLSPIQEAQMKAIQEKGSKVGFETQIRVLVASPVSQQENKLALNTIASTLGQFTASETNGLVKRFDSSREFTVDYILRRFRPRSLPWLPGRTMILNTEELASLYHFPNEFTDTPNIEWLSARTLPPPSNLPADEEGTVVLGKSVYRGEDRPVRIKEDDRRRHVYAIGKTGVGKTTLFIHEIEQDIRAGRGVCYIDPNGDAVESILGLIPKERAEDVIYFDPSDTDRPVGLNMLEWKRPKDRDFLVSEWLEIFYKLFDPNRTGMVGPQFEHWGRNASLSVMARPDGGTLIDIPRLFTDDAFQKETLQHVTDPVVLAFWNQQIAKTADFHKSEMYNYFISKFGRFMTNDLIRNIIGQPESGFDFREIMDTGKIFLINLSKGKIGETNSYLLGMILVSKLQVAAFQRADTPEEERKDFYLYVDEFQNFTTDTFKTILAEARKYRLNLNVTNQYIAQLPEDIRDAVIGNAGTLISFRVGATDAEFMGKEFPNVTEHDLVNLPFASTYVKLLVDGTPTKPFSMRTIKSETPHHAELAEAVQQLSRLKYGRDKSVVDTEMNDRYAVQSAPAPDLPPARESS